MQVELRAHVGVNVATKMPCDLRQDMIFVDNRHMGYVARVPDAPIMLIYPDVPQDYRDAIRAAVVAKYGGQGEKVSAPAAVPQEVIDGTASNDDE